MGRRGPAKVPKKVLAARGSWRAKIAKDDIEAPAGQPTQEIKLDAVGQSLWGRLVSHVESMGLLSVVDGLALTNVCLAWQRCVKAQKALDRHGLTHEVDGVTKARPEVAIVKDAQLAVNQFMAKLALSPVDRTRITAANGANGKTQKDQTVLRYFAADEGA